MFCCCDDYVALDVGSSVCRFLYSFLLILDIYMYFMSRLLAYPEWERLTPQPSCEGGWVMNRTSMCFLLLSEFDWLFAFGATSCLLGWLDAFGVALCLWVALCRLNGFVPLGWLCAFGVA